MIKGITVVRVAGSQATYGRLSSFFAALGFERGAGWRDGPNCGASFLAPLGNLELVEGDLPSSAPILVEVTGLQTVHRIARQWLASIEGTEAAERRIGDIEETGWKSFLFTVEPVAGFSVAFWEWSDPLRGRPLALEGDLSAQGLRFALVVARWNAVITDRLLQGALDALLRSGAARKDLEIIRVPGSWEIPQASRQAALTRRFDAVVALGLLLRGETPHFEAIYNEVSRGIGQSQQETGIPHAFGVLTCETLEQALDRAGLKSGNKGFEAAAAAIEMASLQRKIQGPGTTQAAPGQADIP